MKGEPASFQWQEHPTGSFGPGVSRAAKPERAKPVALLVRQGRGQPMKVTLMAESPKAAVRYAENRWPGAQVEVA